MTKSDLIQIIAVRQNVSRIDANFAVNSILDAIAKNISEQRRVEIRGFGVFGVTYRQARKAHNPANGAPVYVPGKFVPRFKPGKDLSRRINSSDD